jgi:RNA polymerase primary sigma factor
MPTKTRSANASILARYLSEIGQTPLLTAAEEHILARRIQKGDSKARHQMMKANLRLVVNIAKQYAPANEPDLLMDLIQEGNIGLMRAVDRFKADFDTRFSTYGVYWIRQAILRALKARRLVRLPENVMDKVVEMQRVRQRLSQILGRPPVAEELAQEMQIEREEIDRLEEASTEILSLDQMVRGRDDDEQTELRSLLEDVTTPPPAQEAQLSLMQDDVRAAVATLPARERKVVELRFGLGTDQPKTLEEIGHTFGISRERVRQLQIMALKRLRERQQVQWAQQ